MNAKSHQRRRLISTVLIGMAVGLCINSAALAEQSASNQPSKSSNATHTPAEKLVKPKVDVVPSKPQQEIRKLR